MLDTIIGTAEHVADTTLLSKANSQHTYRTERSRVEAQIDAEKRRELYDRLGKYLQKLNENHSASMENGAVTSLKSMWVDVHRFTSKKTIEIYEELLQLLVNRQKKYRDCCSEEELLHSNLKLITDHKGNVLKEDFGIHSEVADQDYSVSCQRIKKRCQLTSEEIVRFINRLSEAEKDDH